MNRFDIRLSMMILVLLVALVAGWSGPALAVGCFIECMHGCYAQWRETVEDTCNAFPCRYLPGCALECVLTAQHNLELCQSGCIADYGG